MTQIGRVPFVILSIAPLLLYLDSISLAQFLVAGRGLSSLRIIMFTRICCHLLLLRHLFQRLADSLCMLHSESFTATLRRFPSP